MRILTQPFVTVAWKYYAVNDGVGQSKALYCERVVYIGREAPYGAIIILLLAISLITMLDIIRDSTIGQIINLVSDGKYLPFEDQKPGFQLRMPHQPISEPKDGLASRDSFSTRVPSRASTAASPKELEAGGVPVKQVIEENPGIDEDAATALARKTAQLVATMPPEFLVDWWDANDPENPR